MINSRSSLTHSIAALVTEVSTRVGRTSLAWDFRFGTAGICGLESWPGLYATDAKAHTRKTTEM